MLVKVALVWTTLLRSISTNLDAMEVTETEEIRGFAVHITVSLEWKIYKIFGEVINRLSWPYWKNQRALESS